MKAHPFCHSQYTLCFHVAMFSVHVQCVQMCVFTYYLVDTWPEQINLLVTGLTKAHKHEALL